MSNSGGGGHHVRSASDHDSLSESRARTRLDLTELIMPEENFWRFSFEKQSTDANDNGGSSEDEPQFQSLARKSCKSNSKSVGKGPMYEFSESQNFSEKLSDVRQTKFCITQEKERSKPVENWKKKRFEAQQQVTVKDRKFIDQNTRTVDRRTSEDLASHGGSFSEDQTSRKGGEEISETASETRTTEERDNVTAHSSRRLDQGIMKESTISLNVNREPEKNQISEDVLSKNSRQRDEAVKSPRANRHLHGRKIRQRAKSGMHSPRTALRIENCKIRAVENLKKAKKMQEKRRRRAFESFAVVKCSFNPQQDFRESMMEMISANGIEEAEELESLLACYLSLNSVEYHAIIVNVFRQVWSALNQHSFRRDLEERHYYQH